MNYKQIYTQLIFKARGRDKPAEYCELHHVLPRSMGGSDEKSNLVWLTGREHFLAHWMLWRIYESPAMARAWWRMACVASASQRYTSRNFQRAREVFALNHSGRHHHKAQAVECMDDGRIFESARIASIAIGARPSGVCAAIRACQKIKGLRFKYVDEPAPIFKEARGMPLKPVKCLDTHEIFRSCDAAGAAKGVHGHSIRVAIRRGRKSAGLNWSWA